jgi:hypothetical protein
MSYLTNNRADVLFVGQTNLTDGELCADSSAWITTTRRETCGDYSVANVILPWDSSTIILKPSKPQHDIWKEPKMSDVEYLSAREIAIREFNSLRGRLCTVIESANLPTRQERALIQMIKNVSYQNQAVVTELIEKLNGSEALFHYAESKLANER